MNWRSAMIWALYWARETKRKHRVVGYRSGGRWAYYVSTGTR